MTKRFGNRTVVDHVDLNVHTGEIFGFLGPNGSGKTTFLRMLCGLLRADGGSGTCLGHDVIAESDAIKREVGYMTQRFSFWEDLSVEENLDFVARMYDVKNRRQAVRESLDQLGLAHRKGQLAGHLSGGWKQRLALVACLIHKPRLLLLDEPTAGVDPKARRDFWDEIHRLAGEGLTVLVTTHYMDEAERCHRLGYISRGKLLTHGVVADVIAHGRLTTWSVSGPNLPALVEKLREQPGVEQTVAFGNSLHVSGSDAAALERAIAPFRTEQYDWRQVESGLEDVFIHLILEFVAPHGLALLLEPNPIPRPIAHLVPTPKHSPHLTQKLFSQPPRPRMSGFAPYCTTPLE
jgi:ABC-2 type transport system ATP-binding protein